MRCLILYINLSWSVLAVDPNPLPKYVYDLVDQKAKHERATAKENADKLMDWCYYCNKTGMSMCFARPLRMFEQPFIASSHRRKAHDVLQRLQEGRKTGDILQPVSVFTFSLRSR